MPKYWGKQIFTHGRFPEVGEKQKAEKKKKEEKRKKRKQVKTMASFTSSTTTCGARKPPGAKTEQWPATHYNATSGGASSYDKPPGPKTEQWPATHCNATSCGARKAAWAKRASRIKHKILQGLGVGPGLYTDHCSHSLSLFFFFLSLSLFLRSLLLTQFRDTQEVKIQNKSFYF